METGQKFPVLSSNHSGRQDLSHYLHWELDGGPKLITNSLRPYRKASTLHPLDSNFRTQLEMESVFLWPKLPCNHWESFAAHQSKLLPANSTLPSECMELTYNLSGNQNNSKTYLVSKMSLYSVLSSCSLLKIYMLLRISVLDRLGLRQHLERQTSFVWCLSASLLPSLHPSLLLEISSQLIMRDVR